MPKNLGAQFLKAGRIPFLVIFLLHLLPQIKTLLVENINTRNIYQSKDFFFKNNHAIYQSDKNLMLINENLKTCPWNAAELEMFHLIAPYFL